MALTLFCEAIDVINLVPGLIELEVKPGRERETLADPKATIVEGVKQQQAIKRDRLVEVVTIINKDTEEVIYQHPGLPRMPREFLESHYRELNASDSSPDAE